MVLMGVSGAGKTTLGTALAEHLGCPFIDCDALHPPANIEKMRGGTALNDADRAPWLEIVAARLEELSRSGTTAVIACSALKKAYRLVILSGCNDALLVHLQANRGVLASRMQNRREHFMPVELLDSQLAAFEEPEPDECALELDAANPLEANIGLILSAMESGNNK